MPAGERPLVTVTARTLWRLRLRQEAPRLLLQAAAVFGLLASARYAIDPPVPSVRVPQLGPATQPDRGAEAFAALFARRYLSWDAEEPEMHRRELAPYVDQQMEAEAGFQPPQAGSQRVLWTQVVQASAGAAGERYTVAVQTDASGLLYLGIGVRRLAGGALALSGYPAFVGPPPIAAAAPLPPSREVQDGALVTVATRALRNYLAGQASELAADLAPGVQVSPPSPSLTLESLYALEWLHAGSSLYALVHANDRAGGSYALAYRLGLADAAGRWEITAIELAGGSD
ncbi:MAG TPA: conjugal transfer protein [Solirubrobacteraceae bacterium]|nr:conjugal transfer protein [Solirubrobacteraceae bacterium]